MLKLLPITAISVLLACISHSRSKCSVGSLVYDVKRDSFYWSIMTVLMILFVGLRTSWNDTYAYLHLYELIDTSASPFAGINWLRLGGNPGFTFVNRILAIIGISPQGFLLIYAAVTIGIYMWFIHKYTNDAAQSVFLFIMMGCFVFTMAAIKQCVAVAFCLLATDRWLHDKKIAFAFWIILALTFHPYAFVYAAVPLCMFTPWTMKTGGMLFASALVGFMLEPLTGLVLGVTSMLGESYSSDALSGAGVNIFRVAVVFVPAVLSFIVRDKVAEQNDKTLNLIVNLSMLNAEIMFIGLFGTANTFARLANYFVMFQALALPKLIALFKPSDRRILIIGMIIGYCAFFYYSYGVTLRFDNNFDNISLLDYLRMLLAGG